MGLFEYEKLKQHGLIPDAPEITKSRTPASKVRKSRCKVNKTIVKGGKRMGTPIRKYQETYYVPMAWIGIIELRQTDVYANQTDSKGLHNDTTYTFKGYEANIPTKLGDVTVNITMQVRQKYGGEYLDEAGREAMQYLKDNGMIPKHADIVSIHNTSYEEIFEQYRDNMIENMRYGVMEVEVGGGFTYTVPATGKKISWEGHEYRSVEEFIDAVTQASEEKMNQFSQLFDDEMERYNAEMAEREALNRQAPEEIRIDFGAGSFNLPRSEHWQHYYYWANALEVNDDNVKLHSYVQISEQLDETAGGYREGAGNLRYIVKVSNTIIDENTQLGDSFYKPNDLSAEFWNREFTAETGNLDDAIATASNFVRETYDEFKAYVASARDYQERSRGRGLKRETYNANEWVYYDSDSPDYVDPDVVYKSKVKKYAGNNHMGMDIEPLMSEYDNLDYLYHEVVDSGEYELDENEARLYHEVDDAIESALKAIYDYAQYLGDRKSIYRR